MSDYCRVCNQTSTPKKVIRGLSDVRKGVEGSWDVSLCQKCGALSIDPFPTLEQLSKYYETYSSSDKINLIPGKGSKLPILRRIYHWLTGDIDPRDFIKPGLNAKLLDYGCGHATYLFDYHARGYDISGADVSDHIVDNCSSQGLDVKKISDFNAIPFEDNEFDIVYLMQVFEHLRDPAIFMAELNRVLKDGGGLYLAIPNKNSIWRKVFGRRWVSGWFVPYHLFHYNTDAIKKLCTDNGFVFVKSWSSTPESWFRLNIKATLYPNETKLDSLRCWLDTLPVRFFLMLCLRFVETIFRERDCLVVKLKKVRE